MSTTVRLVTVAGLLTAGLAAGACDVSVGDGGNLSFDLVAGVAESEDRRSYTLPPNGEIVIENGGGSVDIAAWTESTVEVTITRQAKARTDEAAAALLAQVEILEEIAPQRISLTTSAPRGQSVQVRYVVRAPASMATTVKNQNGNTEITGMTGAVRATQSNGRIQATGIEGPIQATVVNGPVLLDLARVGGDVSLATVNGPVRISIPSTASASLSATVVNGRITTTGLSFEDLNQPSGREMSGLLHGGGPRITLETTNGPIVITGQ